ncbi:MAG: cobalamin biosynthesis protein [Acidobacteria bacterium]|nr:cobalamin biosynthesis protein [Acidobacteriota bacterium]
MLIGVASLAGFGLFLHVQFRKLPGPLGLLAEAAALKLSKSQVAAATIESVSENASDAFVAPLLCYALAGLPGAFAYRFINTCDAMLGYRDQEREWLGKAAARLDDLVNLLPARLTAGLIVVGGVALGGRPIHAVRIWLRDRNLTDSPNAGHPMSAAAGVLGVELEKIGHYRLGCGQRLPAVPDIARAERLLWCTAVAAIIALSAYLFAAP